MTYWRGITRLYIVAAGLWVIWGLYRPIPQHREFAVHFLESADSQMGDCYRMKGEAEMAGFGTLDPDDRCGKAYSKQAEIAYALMRQTPLEIWRENIVSIAADCLLPPAGGAILLASLFWAARGFRSKNINSIGVS